MRIGLISGEYPPMEGGVGDFTRLLGEALVAAGHEVHVLTSGRGSAPVREGGMIVHRQMRGWGPRSAALIRRWAARLSPDVLDLQYQAAAYRLRGWINVAPRLGRGFPSWVTTFHDLLPPYLFPKAGALRQQAVWALARWSDGVIVTNAADEQRLRGAVADLPPLRRIPIGSNIEPSPPPNFDRAAWRKRHALPEEALLIGFFGFLNRSKGVEVLLEAVAAMAREGRPVYVAFIGGRTGSSDASNLRYAAQIEAMIDRLGLGARVLSTGFAAPEEVSAALLAVDLCVLPYRDGASLRRGTLHAALAHGCPIITTEPPVPLPELEGAALFVPREDAEALRGAILRLWRDERLRRELGHAAREAAQQFRWERIAAETAAFFAELRRRRGR